jgi:CheY-like chemotaxis protein/nitrogen-specific signal transduction histidine kinase
VQDITESKQTEEALVVAKERAEESDRLKSAFLSNMSHEIRTPMNGILGFAELLKQTDLAGEKQQEYIQIIEKSGNRMLSIINDIVDISKIESGMMRIWESNINLNEQIEYLYNFFRPEIEDKEIKLIRYKGLSDNDAYITTDGEKLFAILINLLKNAVKYTDEGTIEFGYSKKEGYIEFFIKDTGIGISAERLDAIFERFVQADLSNQMARQGAGLGLSISKAYVTMLQGKIWVTSIEGKGSAFYFTIPYKPVIDNLNPAKKDNDMIEGVNESKKLKILIAEDDDLSEKLIIKYLELITKEIIIAKTGVEALQACRKNSDIDLILMDIRMPLMDGYQATRQIRRFNKDVVIIAQTAYGFTGDLELALKAGCNAYISKPIIEKELLSVIKENIDI